eukprot:scaffold368_cov258-Pinguiococcus_pyrenoidosus.AAC.55
MKNKKSDTSATPRLSTTRRRPAVGRKQSKFLVGHGSALLPPARNSGMRSIQEYRVTHFSDQSQQPGALHRPTKPPAHKVPVPVIQRVQASETAFEWSSLSPKPQELSWSWPLAFFGRASVQRPRA